MKVHRTPALHPFPDLTQPDVAFPRYPAGEIDPNLVVRCARGARGDVVIGRSSTQAAVAASRLERVGSRAPNWSLDRAAWEQIGSRACNAVHRPHSAVQCCHWYLWTARPQAEQHVSHSSKGSWTQPDWHASFPDIALQAGLRVLDHCWTWGAHARELLHRCRCQPDPFLLLALHRRLEGVYLKALDLGELMDRARQAVVVHAQGILKDDPEAELPVSMALNRPQRLGVRPCLHACKAAVRMVRAQGWHAVAHVAWHGMRVPPPRSRPCLPFHAAVLLELERKERISWNRPARGGWLPVEWDPMPLPSNSAVCGAGPALLLLFAALAQVTGSSSRAA